MTGYPLNRVGSNLTICIIPTKYKNKISLKYKNESLLRVPFPSFGGIKGGFINQVIHVDLSILNPSQSPPRGEAFTRLRY
ncbi:hypothetical protein BKI52_20265 [marine bacterium AO1-C]|nr:hypothetical protein BKI52_20265 [marine bacterium AO1-C]